MPEAHTRGGVARSTPAAASYPIREAQALHGIVVAESALPLMRSRVNAKVPPVTLALPPAVESGSRRVTASGTEWGRSCGLT